MARESMENAIRILGVEPHVREIILPKERNLPEADMRLFKPENKALVESAINAMRFFLESHYITDTFRSHERRQKWEKKLLRQNNGQRIALEQALSGNGLRINNLALPNMAAQLLAESYLRRTPKTMQLTNSVLHFKKIEPSVYAAMPMDEKIASANDLKNKVARLLEHLGKKNKASRRLLVASR
ncbi:hypothetical protein HY993_00925 [Candidatus Micrarchaeota archaeon]|nr:hypothetical protein [Candidatus Micrarchaeota archaeon]